MKDDDDDSLTATSTGDCSDENGGRSCVAFIQYEISAKRPGYKGDEDSGTFLLEPVSTATLFPDDMLGVENQAVDIDVFSVTREDGDIVGITKSLKDRVCFCDFETFKDVKEVARLTVLHGSRAVVLKKAPPVEDSSIFSIPLFVARPNDLKELMGHKQLKVSFQKAGSDRVEHSTETNEGDGAKSGCVDQNTDEGNFADAEPGCVEQNAETQRSDDGNGTESESGNTTVSSENGGSGGPRSSEGNRTSPIDLVEHTSSADAPDPQPTRCELYTVTLKIYVPKPETEKVKVQAASDPSRPLFPAKEMEKPLSLLSVDVVRNPKTKMVQELKQNVQGKVVVYESGDVRDVNRVQDFAADQSALALVVSCAPKIQRHIPLFVVNPTVMEKMQNVAQRVGTARFEPLTTSSVPNARYSFPQSMQTVGVSSHPLEDKSAPPPSYAMVLKEGNTSQSSEPGNRFLAQHEASLEGNVADKKSKGLFGGLIDAAGKAVSGLLGGEKVFFEPLKDGQNMLESYDSVIHEISTFLISTDISRCRKLAADAEAFLKQEEGVSLCHIAVSAFLCEKQHNVSLIHATLLALAKFDVSGHEFIILSQQFRGDHRLNGIRNRIYKFLTANTSKFESWTQTRVLKLFQILAACRLFQRQFIAPTWRLLRNAVCTKMDPKEGQLLASIDGTISSAEACLHFERDLNNFVETLLGLKETGLELEGQRHRRLCELFVLVAVDNLEGVPAKIDLLSGWNLCLPLFEEFSRYEYRLKTLATGFVNQASYEELPEMIGTVEETLGPVYKVELMNNVKKRLEHDFQHDKLDWVATNTILQEPRLASFLSLYPVDTVFPAFIERAIQNWLSFEEKMCLVNGFLTFVVRQGNAKKRDEYIQHDLRRQLLVTVRSESSPFNAFSQLVQVLALHKNLFSSGGAGSAVWVLTDCFATSACANTVVLNPSFLADLVHPDEQDTRLYHTVIDQFCRRITDHLKTISRASSFYTECKEVDSEAAQFVGEKVFTFVFNKWNPSEASNVKPEHKSVVEQLFSPHCTPSSEIAKCQHKMSSIFLEYVRNYRTDEIGFCGLEYSRVASETGIWDCAAAFHKMELPGLSCINGKLDRFASLEGSIRGKLTVKDTTMEELFRAYNCVETERVQKLLKDATPLFHGHRMSKTLRELDDDEALATELSTKTPRELELSAHFLHHKSLLFRDRVLRKDGKPHSLETLCKSVMEAVSWLETVIGPGCTYAGVCSAKTAISELQVNINPELSIVLQCDAFETSQVHIEYFHQVSLLADLANPLRRFVACCRQFEFALTEQDSSFASLQREVDSFYERDPHGIHLQECLAFRRSLCHFLFPDLDATQTGAFEEECRRLLPLLKLFSTLSLNPDLWNYANEMEWFGEDGLKLFYQEYNNVTNVLLGDSESYEMSLLDTTEPAMRVVSALGAIRASSKTLPGLIENCKQHDDIQNGLKNCVEKNICQVHTKLSEIKDWFSKGVDEIAAARALFHEAQSGSYFIATRGGDDQDEFPDPFGSYALTLSFDIQHEDGTKTPKTFQGNELDQFMQQLSLIQNENQSYAAEMQGFVDQYEVLKKASSNLLRMFALGFERVYIYDFHCGAGSHNADEATKILKSSEVQIRSFESWLVATRSSFKESLLFWVDELQEIFGLMQSVANKALSPALLLARLSHLQPLWNCKHVGQDVQLAEVEKFALESQQRIASQRGSWMLETSRFLANINDELGTQSYPNQADSSTVVLHTYRCAEDEESRLILNILHNVYKERPPFPFEILDGSVPCNGEQMSLFLERVCAFPAFCFAVVNISMLKSHVLEKLLSFLANREIASLGINLHCIQRGETLHTTPWVSERAWDVDSLANLKQNNSWQSSHSLELKVVTSRCAGAGKTRFIQSHFAGNANAGTIVVHEGTSLSSLTNMLVDKFSDDSDARVLHISFAFLPPRCNESRVWLNEMNYLFFAFISLGSVYDPSTGKSFSVRGTWKIFFELPRGRNAVNWLYENIPSISLNADFCEPPQQYEIDDEARRVCTYLRAVSTGAIDNRFEGGVTKRIVLVLDRSGSMQGRRFEDAIRNAAQILNSHVLEGDEFALVLFDHKVETYIELQTVGPDKQHLLDLVHATPFEEDGGTAFYTALLEVLGMLNARDNLGTTEIDESWIICLTDGESADKHHENRFRQQLVSTDDNLHIVTMGIHLRDTHKWQLEEISQKYGIGDEKGFFVSTDDTTEGMDDAFNIVKTNIPVSQTFELDGALNDDECRGFMSLYLPDFVDLYDMTSQSFWIRFLYRRVKVFDSNHDFNYNEKHDNLGSSLMEVMFGEVKRLLGDNLRRDWLDFNYSQLVYDFTNPTSPEFRLICTAPDHLDPELGNKLSNLDLPGFHVPSKRDLDNRCTLDRFLSQALDIPLEEGKLSCIDDCGFILTLDFTMKLLCIHERVACRIPCLIEGETGVSKTALTKMYSILRNSSLALKARARTTEDLTSILHTLTSEGHLVSGQGGDSLRKLHATIEESGVESEVAARIQILLQGKMANRPALFSVHEGDFSDVRSMLDFFGQSSLEKTFWEINVDSSLTQDDFVEKFTEIRRVSQKLQGTEATVVVFLDEINTSSVLGLLKEIVIDKNIAGEPLEDNIVVIAALNPPREEIQAPGREQDLGQSWASGHYQVAALPESMDKLKWVFGSLTPSQERDFIFRRICSLGNGSSKMTKFLQAALTEVISASHENMREFAKRNILQTMQRSFEAAGKTVPEDQMDTHAETRARSVVSLRDIQRVFSLYEYFSEDLIKGNTSIWSEAELQRRAMLLAVAVVYYLRLDGCSRDDFISMLQSLPTERGHAPSFMEALDQAMDNIFGQTDIPVGIAATRGLKENIFVTVVCEMSQTPLLIVGPPGTSKTLSVNVVDSSANGSDSVSKFYRDRARLSLFHYQCSKQSTSREIAVVFSQAIQRQERVDKEKHRCVVFMDEAGLPEAGRESLKVLHYLLESHMSAKSSVGFVAVSNRVLDAAKSNRCVMLLRQEPDESEMQCITTGVLFGSRVYDVELDGSLLSAHEFASKLWLSYASLFKEGGLTHLVTFFGLRDFIYFLKAVRTASRQEATRFHTSLQSIVGALERNFNGISPKEFRQLCLHFLQPLVGLKNARRDTLFRHPMSVLKDALVSSKSSVKELDRPRFKMIIDCTEDDSILRLLSKGGIAEVSKKSLHKLSNLPDSPDLERLRLVSGVKFAALQGNFAVLSQTEPVNESFYDLFNQRFRVVMGRDGTETLYANIAVGGISRRSLVRPDFECIVHIRESELEGIPAPLINRFECYRLKLSSVLVFGWSKFGHMLDIVEKSRNRVVQLVKVLQGHNNSYGWVGNQDTLDSLFIDMLPHLDGRLWEDQDSSPVFSSASDRFEQVLCDFLQQFTSLKDVTNNVQHVIKTAKDILMHEDAAMLEEMCEAFDTTCMTPMFNSIIKGSLRDDAATRVLVALIQMILTREASFKLIMVATPEIVFNNRLSLPVDVVEEYFKQEHFSLKRLLHQLMLSNRSNFAIVHTRSDQFIHALPSLPANRGLESEDPATVDIVVKLVHEKGPRGMIIENLEKLRSEAAVRGAIETWVDHADRHMFVLLLDMGDKNALDRANFVRMVVEQHFTASSKHQKTFALILHYAPSAYMKAQCYPSLFLGGWEHIFLDSAGSDAVDVDQFVALACHNTQSVPVRMSSPSETNLVQHSILAILPRILPYLASQNLFYPGQVIHDHQSSFQEQKRFLDKLLATTLGAKSMKDILIDKFLSIWLDNALFRTTQAATEALILGTTQLSLSMSIHSTLVQSFQAYMGVTLLNANLWMNFDLIIGGSSPKVLALFGHCLEALPTLPFEELVLQRRQGSRSHLPPLPPSRLSVAKPHFPFFFLLSSFFDELVDSVLQKQRKSGFFDIISCKECYSEAITLLSSGNLNQGTLSERHSLAHAVEAQVAADPGDPDNDESLFQRYCAQYLEFKVGCKPEKSIQQWIQRCLDDFGALKSICGLHVVAAIRKTQLIKIASVLALVDTLPAKGEESKKMDIEPEHANLFELVLCSLEEAVMAHETIAEGAHWFPVVSAFLSQPDAMMASLSRLNDADVACRVRRLTIFFILNECSCTYCLPSSHWLIDWVGKPKVPVHELSLSHFFGGVQLSTQHENHLYERLLAQFLSPKWLAGTNLFKKDDLRFLLECISAGRFSLYHWNAVSLLRGTCTVHGTELGQYGLQSDMLIEIDAKLECENLSCFDSGGKRICIPHYIPRWLQNNSSAQSQQRNQGDAFFVLFKHCYNCSISITSFDMILCNMAKEAEAQNSEDLYLLLQRDIESELSWDRDSVAQKSRLRALGETVGTSLRGTAVAGLVVSARLLCFVAKLAHEVATESTAAVLSGVYADHASMLLEDLMGVENALWQRFLIWYILRQRGEGTLAAVLGAGGPLHRFAWSKVWASGISSLQENTAQSLRNAERALAEAQVEEDRKRNEFRLCPNCRQPFVVYERNCGQFVCGRDAHGTGNNHGCGHSFQVDNAPHYHIDEAILAPLRAQVTEQTANLVVCREGAALWEEARNMPVPATIHLVQDKSPRDSFLPASELLSASSIANAKETGFKEQIELAETLWEAKLLNTQVSALLDIVELYTWLHDSLRYLVTQKEAVQITMKDLMAEQQLRRRFDSSRVSHLLALWDRCKDSFDALLVELDYELQWQCETVQIPRRGLENAPLLSLLSEGQSPADGNDHLFLFIYHTIDVYNSFSKKISRFATDRGEPEEIPPKYLVRGLSGSLKISPFLPSKQDLEGLAEKCWNSEEQRFDFTRLGSELQSLASLRQLPPLISNPLEGLRERFCFREECEGTETSGGNWMIRKQDGLHFANKQDSLLWNETQQILKCFGDEIGDPYMYLALVDTFHGLQYESLRSMLEGCRNLLDLALNNRMMDFCSLESILTELVQVNDEKENPLKAIGFPDLLKKQVDLLITFDLPQVVELVKYLGKQLASEAYLFSSLPLVMAEPLDEEEETNIEEAIAELIKRKGNDTILKLLDEFVVDVLSFYEMQIIDEANQANKSIRTFLYESNFCDIDSFPVFGVVSHRVKLKNYISLRQLLHQIKLSIMLALQTCSMSCVEVCPRESPSFERDGGSWLWQNSDLGFMSSDQIERRQLRRSTVHGKLWFENIISHSDNADETSSDIFDEDMQDSNEEMGETDLVHVAPAGDLSSNKQETVWNHSAIVVQRWWRYESSRMDVENEAESKQTEGVGAIPETHQHESTQMSAQGAPDDTATVDRGQSMAIDPTYGRPEDEVELLKWLDENELPQTIAGVLLGLGGRTIKDVCMLVQECLLDNTSLPPLDKLKLKKAVSRMNV